ncbi:MAG TPA: peptidase E [Candidatus Eremiobacteraceae bacterium]|nr:peptidase E [Candidatus Eremiobacteraceae bacterium]
MSATRGRKVRRQIIPIGGTSNDARRLRIMRYVFEQTGKKRPRVLYLPTASGDDSRTCERFTHLCRKLGVSPTIYSVFKPHVKDVRRLALAHDVIFVAGGNTRDLLVLWKLWGVDVAVRAAYRRGAVLAGPSAGGMCWFECGLTDSMPLELTALRCLGMLEGSFCPHYDSEKKRRPTLRRLVGSGKLTAGFAVEDDVALHFVDERLVDVVSVRNGARAYRVSRHGSRMREAPLEPHHLPR